MFTNQDIIVIAFKLTNFIALIGIALFLFKKHVLPDLLLSLARKKNRQESLFLQQSHLEKQQLQLDILLKNDALQCEAFRAKIDEWTNVVKQEQHNLEKERINTIALARKRIEHKTLQREENRVQKIVAHAVVERLEKS